MAMDTEIKRQMDMDAEEARTDFAAIMKTMPEVAQAQPVIKEWLRKWYIKAGYKRLAKIIMSSVLFVGCAGAPVCSIDNIYVYDAGVCLEAYAEAMDEEECFTDTCVEMDEMAYHQATGRVWE